MDPGAVGLLFRMDVLEVLHVLADDEQMILPFVDDFELLDRFTGAGMKNPEEQLRLLPGLHDSRHGAEVQA